MRDEQVRQFRILAVGYAIMRDLSEQGGGDAVGALVASSSGDMVARALGRAAIAAVEATAEVERNG